MGIKVQSEVPIPIFYRVQSIHEKRFRLDIVVEDKVIVELKSVEEVKPVHKKTLDLFTFG